MIYVYMLQSISPPEHFYVGLTSDLKKRFAEHNRRESIQLNDGSVPAASDLSFSNNPWP